MQNELCCQTQVSQGWPLLGYEYSYTSLSHEGPYDAFLDAIHIGNISGFIPYSVGHADSSPGRGWQPPRTRGGWRGNSNPRMLLFSTCSGTHLSDVHDPRVTTGIHQRRIWSEDECHDDPRLTESNVLSNGQSECTSTTKIAWARHCPCTAEAEEAMMSRTRRRPKAVWKWQCCNTS